jgi:leader peptidase (prepilin peptidase) / N-methyltransferase
VTLGELPYWFVAGLAILLGLVWGSFLNVVIHRLPREESLVRPGSRCPGCGAAIRAWHNLPVVSWLMLRGRASCCGARISPRYPLVELLGGLLAWAIVETRITSLPSETEAWRAAALFALYGALGLGLIAAAFIDLEHMILPDSITIGGALLGITSALLRPELTLIDALIGAGVGFVIVWLPFLVVYPLIRGRPGMGLGDAKLTMLAGAWFGWPGAVFALLAGAVQGSLVAFVVYFVAGKIEEPEAVRRERQELLAEIAAAEGEERRQLEAELALDPIGTEPEPGLALARLAFGPFLVLATLEFLLFGDALVTLYLAWAWNV